MRLKNAGIRTQKSKRVKSDELLSTQYLLQSGMLHRYGAGIYAKHNILLKLQQNIVTVIRTNLDDFDCIEVELPELQPTDIWDKSGRFKRYQKSGEMFTTGKDKFCMAPTAEEAMLEFSSSLLRSHRDLPATFYQFGTKFRNEMRAHGGLFRSKEFLMMDAYSFHDTEESLREQYKILRRCYFEIFHNLGLDVLPVSALSGEMGGNYSEEFMLLADSGQDTILVNKDHTLAFNTEILNLDNASEYLKNFGISQEDLSDFEEKRAIEVGHIFQLGQKYSRAMGATFKDGSNKDIPYYMGCYGIGVSRLVGALLEVNCDEKGLYIPEEVAPYHVEIVFTHDKMEMAFQIYSELNHLNISVIIDDRDGYSLGEKIRDWQLIGIPYLVVIGKNFDGRVLEVESRKGGWKSFMTPHELKKLLR